MIDFKKLSQFTIVEKLTATYRLTWEEWNIT